MHCKSWLAVVILLSTAASAFYPIDLTKDVGNSVGSAKNSKRFYPATTETLGNEGGPSQPLRLDIRKRWIPKVKRTNNFNVVLASQPDMPDGLAISQDGQDFSYISSIKFGSAGKELWMLIDSGAANTWVMGSDCTTDACQAHDTFGKADSKTLNISTDQWGVSYGTGTVGGFVASDSVAFANFKVQLGFGLAKNASSDFLSYPMDGILGLGRPDSNKLGTPGIMTVLENQKLIKNNLYGVHLQRAADGAMDGQITFGEVDSSKFSGDLSWTKSVSSDGIWEIPVDDAGVGGTKAGFKGKTAIIDTGTSYILMPPDDAKKLHALFQGSTGSGENYLIPCSSTADLQYTFSGVTYNVSSKDYLGKPDSTGKMCASNIVGHQAFGDNTWLIGDVFLKNVYSVFDFDKDRIGKL